MVTGVEGQQSVISGQQATAGGGVNYCSPYPWNPSGGNTPSGRDLSLYIRDNAAVDPKICAQAARRLLSDDIDETELEWRGRRLRTWTAQDTVMSSAVFVSF